MLDRLPRDVLVTVISSLGCEHVLMCATVSRSFLALVPECINALARTFHICDTLSDHHMHNLLGYEMRKDLRELFRGDASWRARALLWSESLSFQLHRPSFDQLMLDTGSVVWMEGACVRLEPSHVFLDEVLPFVAADWGQLSVELAAINATFEQDLCAGARIDAQRRLGLQLQVLHSRRDGIDNRVHILSKQLHQETRCLFAMLVSAPAARLLRAGLDAMRAGYNVL